MRTLYTGTVLDYILLRYEKLINTELKAFLEEVIIRVDIKSEIERKNADILADTLHDIQCEGDYSNEMIEGFLELIERLEVNVRIPCPMV